MGEGANSFTRTDAGEYLLELLTDVLQQLEPAARGAFLQKFLQGLASVELSPQESLSEWQAVLRRQKELAERLGEPVSLRTAALDYFANRLQSPILLEYREFKRLQQNALTDPLTGLYNRRLFDEYAGKELNRSRRYSYPLTLLLFDLRNFKKVNDSYGHAVGDEVLRCLARACLETVRGSDYACRIGGDEFALLLPQSERESAASLAQRIAEKFLEAARAVAPEAGLDYGAASFPGDGETPQSLFEAADKALYAYKRQPEIATREAPPPAEPSAPKVPARVLAPPAALPALAEPADTWRPQQRRYERIPLGQTRAYGILTDSGQATVARVLDLSFGGVSFLVDEGLQLPDTFEAWLNVPVLPAADFKLRRVYSQPMAPGVARVGCSFAA